MAYKQEERILDEVKYFHKTWAKNFNFLSVNVIHLKT